MRTLKEIAEQPLQELKVGDMVWSSMFGFCRINQLDAYYNYYYDVITDDGINYEFTKTGKFNLEDIYRCLFTMSEAAELGYYQEPKYNELALLVFNNAAKICRYEGNGNYRYMNTYCQISDNNFVVKTLSTETQNELRKCLDR